MLIRQILSAIDILNFYLDLRYDIRKNTNTKKTGSMINKWADKGKFTVIKVGSRVRILRDEFEDWMEQRDLERSMQ